MFKTNIFGEIKEFDNFVDAFREIYLYQSNYKFTPSNYNDLRSQKDRDKYLEELTNNYDSFIENVCLIVSGEYWNWYKIKSVAYEEYKLLSVDGLLLA